MSRRSERQREANELDLEMFRLSQRLDGWVNRRECTEVQRVALTEASVAVYMARRHVRAHMHPADVEAT